jgi:glycerophosphoryl diester phosphodiesterase
MIETLVIAHRGDIQHAPECSISAFASAITKGADGIEFDLHLTKDEQLVVHHDHQLGRTESASGLIGDYSLAELRKFDIGSWFGENFRGEKMPTLSDVLDLGKGKVRFEIELRVPMLTFLEMVLDDIDQSGVLNDVEITSPHVPLLMHARNARSGLRTGVFFYPYPEWKPPSLGQQHLIDWMTLLDAQVAHLPHCLIEEEFVERLHAHNFLVHGSNFQEEDEIKEAISKGIDQFSTDKLELALKVRDLMDRRTG